jgi:DNA-binding IclR family transcriptional regulator
VTQVPAAHRALEVLLTLARAAGPIPAATIARECAIPKSSLYHLLGAMEAHGFVTPAGNSTWGLGVSAFEVGSAYIRHEPMERRARPLLAEAVSRLKRVGSVVGHVGILRGHDTLYLVKESTSTSITLVTDVGVRLPANLTASGRAMLAHMSDSQVRALFPDSSAFIDRTGNGPQTLSALRNLLRKEREKGYAHEVGFISPGYSSIACAVFDHLRQPVSAIGITYRNNTISDAGERIIIEVVQDSAHTLTQRIGGLNP